MRRIALAVSSFLSSLAIASYSYAAPYKIDAAHSQVLFKIKHLGISSVSGRFDSFEGTIDYDPSNVAASKTAATIDVLSINTNQKKRDDHLRSCDFFCTEKFQKMTFASKQVKDLGNGKLEITGDLTLHGVTKTVTLDAEFGGQAKDPSGNEKIAFTATTTINRKDFGLAWSKLTETGGILVGDEVKVTIEIEANKAA